MVLASVIMIFISSHITRGCCGSGICVGLVCWVRGTLSSGARKLLTSLGYGEDSCVAPVCRYKKQAAS